MRESRTYGSVRGALSNGRPYRDPLLPSRVRAARVRAARTCTGKPAISGIPGACRRQREACPDGAATGEAVPHHPYLLPYFSGRAGGAASLHPPPGPHALAAAPRPAMRPRT